MGWQTVIAQTLPKVIVGDILSDPLMLKNAMKSETLYQMISDEYNIDMVAAIRKDGRSYYWQKKSTGPESSRIVRISENSAGDVAQLKLVVNENRGLADVFFPLPAHDENIMDAVRSQVALYLGNV